MEIKQLDYYLIQIPYLICLFIGILLLIICESAYMGYRFGQAYAVLVRETISYLKTAAFKYTFIYVF